MTSPTDNGRHIAFFTGSFDPFTRGHESIVLRALPLFHEVVIGIGINPSKTPMLSLQQRLDLIKATFACHKQVRVMSYEGLTVDAARQIGATCIIKGIRNATDLQYEQKMANYNRDASGIETLFLFTLPGEEGISSTCFRQMVATGQPVGHLLPRNCPKHLFPPEWNTTTCD
ncbi:MAG: pantetheine-phosphate adenylyltransferase [Muribaculaceae bacterium]